MLGRRRPAAGVADQFEVTLVWMADEPMMPGALPDKIGRRRWSAPRAPIKYKINVNTLEHAAATTLELNEIGVCNFSLSQPIPFDRYRENRDTGGFILIDRLTNATVGAGMIHFALRRAHNIHWQALDVDKEARAAAKGQKPCVIWFTGLSGAGKSTIANLVEKRLHAPGRHTYLLDGDNVRHGLNRDLGFTEADRVENIRRVGEVAKLIVDAGLDRAGVLHLAVPRSERRMARELLEGGRVRRGVCRCVAGSRRKRDAKGLYDKARRGEIEEPHRHHPPYEPPENPEIVLDTNRLSAAESANLVIHKLIEYEASSRRFN